MFKEQVLLLPLDQDSETVAIAVVVCGSGRSEVPDSLNGKGSAVSPSDRGWQHVASRIKFRGDPYIDTLDLDSFGYRHVDHLRSLVLGPQEVVVDINGQLGVLTPADQAVHLKRKKRRWNAELFGNAEKVGVAGVNQIQHLLIIQ